MKQIKAVKLLYPSLMSEGAAQEILNVHHQMASKEEELNQCNMRAIALEKEIAAIKARLDAISNLYEIVYEDEAPKKEIVKGEAPAIVESNGTIHIG